MSQSQLLRAWLLETWIVKALLLFALALGLTWPQVLHPTRLFGAEGGEVDNHFWMLWVATQRLLGDAGPFGNAPLGWEIPLMDPINLAWWLPFAWFQPELGYTAVVWANLVIAGFGGGELAVAILRRSSGAVPPENQSRMAFWAGAVAAMASPPLLGFMDFGITEGWTVGWYGLHGAWLLRWSEYRPESANETASDPVAERTARRYLWGSAVAAAAVWGSGWYNVFFMGVTEPLLWLACGRWSWKLPAMAVLAAVPRLPALWYTHTHFALWSSRMSGTSEPVRNDAWIGRPFNGADLAALFRPSPEAMMVSHAMYLGWATLLFTGLAFVVRGTNNGLGKASAQRVTRRPMTWVFVAAVVLAVLSLGQRLRFMGLPVIGDALAPAGLLTVLIPSLRGITHWERAEIPVGMLLAGLAGAAVGRIGKRGWTAAAVVLLIGDSLAFGGNRYPRQSYATDLPAELLSLSGSGPLMMVPVDNTVDPPRSRSRRPYNQWQVFFKRAVSENYEGPDYVSRAPAVSWLNRTCGVRPAPREGQPVPWDLKTLADLGTDGFEWLVLVPALAPNARDCAAAITEALGTAAVGANGEPGARILAWPLKPTGTSAIEAGRGLSKPAQPARPPRK